MTAAPSNLPPDAGSGPQASPETPSPRAAAPMPASTVSPPDGKSGARPNSQRLPAPPPPPARAASMGYAPEGAPPGGPEHGPAAKALATRRHARHQLEAGPPARITLGNRQPVFVTLCDISSGGCCILRRGQLEVASGEPVVLDIWTQDIATKLSIHARVCWFCQHDNTCRAGLRFVETNHRLQRQIDLYAEHFRQPVESDRPVAYRPGVSRTLANEPSVDLVPPPPPSVRSRPRVATPRPTAGSPSPSLAAMPRTPRQRALERQQRMRRSHREEVARIAEETGIHIHTLYGWLRTLRLEGEISAERPNDPESWSATDKFTALLEVAGLSPAERARFCEQHGLSEEQLKQWRQAALEANTKPLLVLRAQEELQSLRERDQREVRRLQQELRRKVHSVAISEELLQVVRKLQAFWEEGEGH